MSKYAFSDSNPENGFFAKLQADGINSKATLKKQTKNDKGTVIASREKTLKGNMLPGVTRLKRPQWDSDKQKWNIMMPESELLELAKEMGATDSEGREISKISYYRKNDPFITSIKIPMSDEFVLDDETPLGKIHKAVLDGRRDIITKDNEDELSAYDKRYNLQYKSVKIGDRTEESVSDTLDLDEKIKFYTALGGKTLAVKSMMVERLGVFIEDIPEESVINSMLVKKWEAEGNVTVAMKNGSAYTNRRLIDKMMLQDTGDIETEYYIYKAHRSNIILWLSEYKYYEFAGINLGRTLDEVIRFLTEDKNSDLCQKVIVEVKELESAAKNAKKPKKK
jgi:hypothetical protein